MSKMQVVYVPEAAPERFSKSIFLAGPSPRGQEDVNWRPEALQILEELGYDGVVFVPLPRTGDWSHGYDNQVDWELQHLHMSDVVAFWVPRDTKKLPAYTTNVEYGMFFDTGKAILGYPPEAQKMRYLAHLAQQEFVPMASTLKDTLKLAVERLSTGDERVGGERMVPLHIWRLPHFQQWLMAQKGAGNRLDGARLLWSFRVGWAKSFTFAFAMHVNVFVAAENRNKTNEFVISRPDIATIVAYRKRPYVLDTAVVLIREFRSPGRTPDGFIRELPGGSSFKPNEDPFITAAHELSEETGFQVDSSRLRLVGARQLCGTFTSHQAHVFACEISAHELDLLRQQQAEGVVHGIAEDSERTYVEVHRLGDLLDASSQAVDWSMLGMIFTAIYD